MHQLQWIATVCDRVLKRSNNQGSLESRMFGNLQVRFGVGAGVKSPGPHHANSRFCLSSEVFCRRPHRRTKMRRTPSRTWARPEHVQSIAICDQHLFAGLTSRAYDGRHFGYFPLWGMLLPRTAMPQADSARFDSETN